MAVQRLQGKAAGVDFPAFGHKLRQLIGVVLMAWESFGAEGGEPALHAEHHPGPYSRMEVAKPLRCRRVACSILTKPIEPSKATVWNVTSAFCPGSAFTSSKTFSS